MTCTHCLRESGVPAPSWHSFHYGHAPEQKEEANHRECPQLEGLSLTYNMAVTTSQITSRMLGPKNDQRSPADGLNLAHQASGSQKK